MVMTREQAEGRPVSEVLAWSREMIDPVLRAAVDTLTAPVQRVAAYHFGWCDETGRPLTGGAGKAVRPALALLSAQVVGGTAHAAVPAAVAVELVHNFSLLHDDVMDGDLTRRHRPTAWTVFGTNAAILTGDALLALALDVLATAPAPRSSVNVLGTLSTAVQEVVAGQLSDVMFEQRSDVTLVECIGMVQGKTCSTIACSCSLGARYGGADPAREAELREFGQRLGLAFQMIDDLLGIWGDPARTGKPVFSDLRNRKKSLPVVAALTSGTAEGRELGRLYSRPEPPSRPDLIRTAELIELAGGRAWCADQADLLLGEALDRLGAVDPRPEAAAELTALARYVTLRDR
jgi:geranylgeranyl diphosphate synthase, type I